MASRIVYVNISVKALKLLAIQEVLELSQDMQQKTCGSSDGALNGRYIGNDMQLAKGPNTSDG